MIRLLLAVALTTSSFCLAADPPKAAAPKAPVFERLEVLEVMETEQGFAVLLFKKSEELVLPIFIGPAEGLAIQMRLKKQTSPRPMTHDLLEDVIEALGAKLVRIEVDDLKSDVFLGRLILEQKDGKSLTVDARPSDSIAIALGLGAPILVSRRVLDRAGVPVKDFGKKRERVDPPPKTKTESL